MGFEPQVNQRLLPPTFPRYTQIRSRVEALKHLVQLMERIKLLCKIKDHTNFHAALVSWLFLGGQFHFFVKIYFVLFSLGLFLQQCAPQAPAVCIVSLAASTTVHTLVQSCFRSAASNRSVAGRGAYVHCTACSHEWPRSSRRIATICASSRMHRPAVSAVRSPNGFFNPNRWS